MDYQEFERRKKEIVEEEAKEAVKRMTKRLARLFVAKAVEDFIEAKFPADTKKDGG